MEYTTKTIKTGHSIIIVQRPVLTDEEREKRYQDLIEQVKIEYRNGGIK